MNSLSPVVVGGSETPRKNQSALRLCIPSRQHCRVPLGRRINASWRGVSRVCGFEMRNSITAIGRSIKHSTLHCWFCACMSGIFGNNQLRIDTLTVTWYYLRASSELITHNITMISRIDHRLELTFSAVGRVVVVPATICCFHSGRRRSHKLQHGLTIDKFKPAIVFPHLG